MEKLKQAAKAAYEDRIDTVKRRMKLFGVTQKQLAMLMRTTENNLSRWLTLEMVPNTITYIYLEKVLDKHIQSIIARREYDHRQTKMFKS